MRRLESLFGRPLRLHMLGSIVAWLLLAVLVIGAAAFSQGSRYALVPAPSAFGAAPADAASSVVGPVVETTVATPPAGQGLGTDVLPATSETLDTYVSVPCLDQGPSHQYDCACYRAPRGEPSPTRAFISSPSQAQHTSSPVMNQDAGLLSTVPVRHALTVVALG